MFLFLTASISACPPASPPPHRADGVVVHLFEWPWADVARECELVLGPAGYAAVQVSPAQEHVVVPGRPWWERYQPVSHRLDGRLGDRAAFADMVRRCDAAGVDVIADVVLNHTTGLASGVGSAGTRFTRYAHPGLYGDADFHACRRPITDWGSRWEVHQCDLLGLADLDTSRPSVRARAADHLRDLAGLGVDGIRVDSAKHVDPADLRAILTGARADLDVYLEVIDAEGEAVRAVEYVGLGRVTDFRYGPALSAAIRAARPDRLRTLGADHPVPGDRSVVFVDNHDTQRAPAGARPLTFEDGRLHELAVAFLLAWPHGRPLVTSSYAFHHRDQGPPALPDGRLRPALDPSGACTPGRVCEHRAPSTVGMVGLRNAVGDAPVERWWSDGARIAFSRGRRGFVALNADPHGRLEATLSTGLPAGRYCDVTTGCARSLVVDADGRAAVSLGPLDILAAYAARVPVPVPPPVPDTSQLR